jgi:hypothetical protein
MPTAPQIRCHLTVQQTQVIADPVRAPPARDPQRHDPTLQPSRASVWRTVGARRTMVHRAVELTRPSARTREQCEQLSLPSSGGEMSGVSALVRN